MVFTGFHRVFTLISDVSDMFSFLVGAGDLIFQLDDSLYRLWREIHRPFLAAISRSCRGMPDPAPIPGGASHLGPLEPRNASQVERVMPKLMPADQCHLSGPSTRSCSHQFSMDFQ